MSAAEVPAADPGPLRAWHPALQLSLLLTLGSLLMALFERAGVPAALLLGPMVAAMLVRTSGGSLVVPRKAYLVAQSLLGAFIGSNMAGQHAVGVWQNWPLFVGVALSIVLATSALSWTVARWGSLPGTTAIWGLSPGAATIMVIMAESFGEDGSLVAFMQYLRNLVVAMLTAFLTRLWFDSPASGLASVQWFPEIHLGAWFVLAAVAAGGALIGRRLRVPAGMILGPMALGAAVQASGWVTLEMPPWLQALTFMTLGCQFGFGFTRKLCRHVGRALPLIVASILSMLVVCALFGWLLVRTLQIDPLSAFLATSPGGMDAVVIIAASSGASVPFVMAVQTVRFLVVLAVAPPLARLVAGRMQAPPG
ncbi:MAG: AbrB family transcriptional regulator [Pseudomonadota bacterium]